MRSHYEALREERQRNILSIAGSIRDEDDEQDNDMDTINAEDTLEFMLTSLDTCEPRSDSCEMENMRVYQAMFV